MSDIREKLADLEIQNYEQRCFVPHDSLKDLLSESRVAALIHTLSEKREIEVWLQSEIIDIVIKNGLRVFATLLSFSQPELILKFKDTDHFAHGQLDSRLPLSEESLRLILRDNELSAKFYKNQWRFLAPFFRADQSHRQLQNSVILPFVKCETLADGGFGEVHKMTMAASHQGLVPKERSQVKNSQSLYPLVLTSSLH